MPILSYIVPVYNTAPYLSRCLDSLFQQSHQDFEILAVDDGSTDESLSILQTLAQAHPEKLRVFHKENGGLSHTRNFALDQAVGEFVAFVDSDDFLSPQFGEKMVGLAQESDLDMVLCDFYYSFDSGENRYSSIVGNKKAEDPKREALIAAPMACPRLFRRSLFDRLRFQKGIWYEDLELTPRLLLHCKKVGFVKEALYYYYQRSGSIMHETKFHENFTHIFTVLDHVYSYYREQGLLEEYEREIEFLYIEHLLRSAALRFSLFAEGKPLFHRLRKEVKERFPHWKKNPYLPCTSLFFRLTVRLCALGQFSLVRLLAKWKG